MLTVTEPTNNEVRKLESKVLRLLAFIATCRHKVRSEAIFCSKNPINVLCVTVLALIKASFDSNVFL